MSAGRGPAPPPRPVQEAGFVLHPLCIFFLSFHKTPSFCLRAPPLPSFSCSGREGGAPPGRRLAHGNGPGTAAGPPRDPRPLGGAARPRPRTKAAAPHGRPSPGPPPSPPEQPRRCGSPSPGAAAPRPLSCLAASARLWKEAVETMGVGEAMPQPGGALSECLLPGVGALYTPGRCRVSVITSGANVVVGI